MTIDWTLTINNSAIQRIVESVKKKMYDAAYQAAVEIIDEMEQDLQKIYNDVIDEFYGSYSPVFYDRNESLRDLLEMNADGESIHWGFNAEAATPFERGGGSQGLYEHVFRQGWHGGATGTDHNNQTVNVPSWRYPYPFYSIWGSEAPQAPRAPLEAWNQEVEAYKADVLPQRYAALYRKQLQKRGFK